MRLGHSVPGADQTTAVFSPRNSEYLGREQPVSEQTVVRARASPGSPLGCSWHPGMLVGVPVSGTLWASRTNPSPSRGQSPM